MKEIYYIKSCCVQCPPSSFKFSPYVVDRLPWELSRGITESQRTSNVQLLSTLPQRNYINHFFISNKSLELANWSMNAATSQSSLTPLRRLALHSTSTCATQASAYGQCILATYQDVKKDVCKNEFAKFGQCLREAVRRISKGNCYPADHDFADEA